MHIHPIPSAGLPLPQTKPAASSPKKTFAPIRLPIGAGKEEPLLVAPVSDPSTLTHTQLRAHIFFSPLCTLQKTMAPIQKKREMRHHLLYQPNPAKPNHHSASAYTAIHKQNKDHFPSFPFINIFLFVNSSTAPILLLLFPVQHNQHNKTGSFK
jgi:hypothetical protein